MKKGDKVFVEAGFRERFDEKHVSVDFPAGYRVVIDESKTEFVDANLFFNSVGATSPFFQRLQEAEKIIDRLSRTMVANLTVEALNYKKKWKPPGVDNLRKVLKDMSDSVADDLKGKIILEDSYAKDAEVINLTYKNKFPQTPQDDELDAMTEDVMGRSYRQAQKMQADGQSPRPEDARKFMHNYLAPFPEESENEKP